MLVVGLDYLTIDPPEEPTFPADLELLGHETLIIENLNLREVEAGFYELLAAPVKLRGSGWRVVPGFAEEPNMNESDRGVRAIPPKHEPMGWCHVSWRPEWYRRTRTGGAQSGANKPLGN